MLRQLLLDGLRQLAEHQVLDRLGGREHAEQILRSDHPVEGLADRHPAAVGPAEVDVIGVEVEHEDAVFRIPREREAVALRVRIAAVGERGPLRVLDELEPVDGLRLVVFEQLEVRRGEAGDRASVASRIGVDADEVRARPEGGRPLGIGLLILRLSLRREPRGCEQ